MNNIIYIIKYLIMYEKTKDPNHTVNLLTFLQTFSFGFHYFRNLKSHVQFI